MDVTVRELADHSAPIFDWSVIIFTSPVAAVSVSKAMRGAFQSVFYSAITVSRRVLVGM